MKVGIPSFIVALQKLNLKRKKRKSSYFLSHTKNKIF